MAIVIRVLYENQQWREKCKSPFTDPLCWKCQEARRDLDQGKPLKLNITPPKINDVDGKECSGACWESNLGNSFDWGNEKKFREVMPGMKVFLVFEQRNESNRIEYRIWGKTTVKSVNVPPIRKYVHTGGKYKYWIHLEPFEPLPREKWSKALCDIDLIGSEWKQGFYRYIRGEGREAFLEKLALGVPFEEAVSDLTIAPNTVKKTKYGLLAPNIEQKIEEMAMNQGRTREEIIRQAVAELLKKQE